MKKRTVTHSPIDIHQKYFWIAVSTCVFMMFLYVFFINVTVFAAAEQQQIKSDIKELHSTISELEVAFIEKEQEITFEFALSQGFTEVSDTQKIFVSRKPLTRLSLNNL